ncbi:MAG TPA: hypothetical protein VHN80_00970, partial [Kineosporiaceae bacterium]|nr:hypothetical protein [Kineosporiaceae bacterium]
NGVSSAGRVTVPPSSTTPAAAGVVELGGTVTRPAEETPFGRMADVSDPNGAPFKLHQPPANDAAGSAG